MVFPPLCWVEKFHVFAGKPETNYKKYIFLFVLSDSVIFLLLKVPMAYLGNILCLSGSGVSI